MPKFLSELRDMVVELYREKKGERGGGAAGGRRRRVPGGEDEGRHDKI